MTKFVWLSMEVGNRNPPGEFLLNTDARYSELLSSYLRAYILFLIFSSIFIPCRKKK